MRIVQAKLLRPGADQEHSGDKAERRGDQGDPAAPEQRAILTLIDLPNTRIVDPPGARINLCHVLAPRVAPQPGNDETG